MEDNTIIISAYPKSGNTMITTWLNLAGEVTVSNDIHLLEKGSKNQPNLLFKEKTYVVKSHYMWQPDVKLDLLYSGKVSKVISLVRNPFDTFLSNINYIKKIFGHIWDNKHPYAKLLNNFTDNYPLNESTYKTWNLDHLRDSGHLNKFFRNFINLNGVFPFYNGAGKDDVNSYGNWATHFRSFENCQLPVLYLRYEDIISNPNNPALQKKYLKKISSFLDISFDLLEESVKKQNDMASITRSQKNKDFNFFNKMKSNYWKDYLDMNLCRKFASENYHAIKYNGYSELLDEIFTNS